MNVTVAQPVTAINMTMFVPGPEGTLENATMLDVTNGMEQNQASDNFDDNTSFVLNFSIMYFLH